MLKVGKTEIGPFRHRPQTYVCIYNKCINVIRGSKCLRVSPACVRVIVGLQALRLNTAAGSIARTNTAAVTIRTSAALLTT